ncbi:MAG: hypothetical protein ACRD3N_03240 [Terracidiphilus sp.]
MPLFADGLDKIRRNLLRVQAGEKPWLTKIGFFTPEQIAAINEARTAMGFPALRPEIVFHGVHLYKSRCVKYPYTIDQVLEQIKSAFSEESIVDPSRPSVVLRNPNKRIDHNGASVNDEAIFECYGRQPHADLYSVVPEGDGLRVKAKKAIQAAPKNAIGPREA